MTLKDIFGFISRYEYLVIKDAYEKVIYDNPYYEMTNETKEEIQDFTVANLGAYSKTKGKEEIEYLEIMVYDRT